MTIFGGIGILIGITNLALSIFVLIRDRTNIINRYWALFTLSVSSWGFTSYAISIATDPVTAIVIWRLALAGVIFIPATFLIFTFAFLNKPYNKLPIYISIITIIFLLLDSTHYFLNEVQIKFETIFWNQPSHLYNIFVLYFILCISYAIYLAIKEYFRVDDTQRRKQLLFFIWAASIGFIGGSTSYLPTYNINLYPYPNAAIVIFSIIITYTIAKYRLFNIKIIGSELITIILLFTILIRMVFAQNSREFSIEFILFIISTIIGIILINSVYKEHKQRLELASLNAHLEQRVAEKTVEVRRAFELEKQARRDLEKLNETKDQFIMITQHHLRTPTSYIRTGIEEIRSSMHGSLSTETTRALEAVNVWVGRLGRVVDDFLAIATLKVGSQIMNFAPTSLQGILHETLEELSTDIQTRNIRVAMPTSETWPLVNIDAAKMREALLIIVENAVKYNIPGGSIRVESSSDTQMAWLGIENTGIGIDRRDAEKLGSSLYYRGATAKTANPVGMGIGLFVARAIIQAHQGTLSITSKGAGKGAFVRIMLPLWTEANHSAS